MAMIEAQATASNPTHSVWVAANAGTGKTKVLTDRVLRLLLAGTPPARILCLTYTKAAAAEMENRIQETLRRWVGLDDEALRKALGELGHAPSADLMRSARQLFATVLDAADGVRIQTIHGFCQSLLKRFPLEAQLHPQIEVMDERTAQEFLAEAKQRLFAEVAREPDAALAKAVGVLVERLAESTFQELLDKLVQDRRNLLAALDVHGDASAMADACRKALGVQAEQTEADIYHAHFTYDDLTQERLRAVASLMLESDKLTDLTRGAALADWLNMASESRQQTVETYLAQWLTGDKTPVKRLATKAVYDRDADAQDILLREQQRVANYWQAICAFSNWQFTQASLEVIGSLLRHYNKLKSNHNALDYDDLILHSLRLLRSVNAQWILYKLDGGLDHILIDEAQDTSPEQWSLVEALIADFFSGEAAHESSGLPRTLFVVGDDKQSIYRFQGAQPKAFSEKRQLFSHRAQQGGQSFAKVPMVLSFRSTDAVLAAVDATFSQPDVRAGVSYDTDEVRHQVFRTGEAGLVELWPLAEPPENEKADVWQIKSESESVVDASAKLAEQIASTVSEWLRNSEWLEAKGRPIQASDVLVLVRKRGQFMEQLVRAFKRADVPVAGMDRMNLPDSLAVSDLLALAEFLLLPHDDLSLACALKSPLVGLDEEALFACAYGRPKGMSLWERIQQMRSQAHCPKPIEQAHDLLADLLAQVDYIRPYELFSHLLDAGGARARLVARLGEEVLDPVEEFLSLALFYESSHAPSLQGFMQWIRSGKVEVVRDMEQGQNLVRVMTVHGAKGLQAPIVFMPDTTSTPTMRNSPLWEEVEGRKTLFLSPSAKEDAAYTAQLRNRLKQEEAEEYRRLLYVAMTRAEDRLYIAGWKPKGKNVAQDSWYRWLENGLKPHMNEIAQSDGNSVWRMTCPQEKEVKHIMTEAAQQTYATCPETLLLPPAPEPFPPRPLAPSRMEGEEVAVTSLSKPPSEDERETEAISPIKDASRFRRGNLMHALLQWLPDVPVAQRRPMAERYLSTQAADLPPQMRGDMVDDVLAVLDAPEMAPVFGPGSLAEVPLTGLIGQAHVLSGQVDRLCVREDGVWLVDYKTQRQPPQSLKEVPQAYLRQMAIYRDALSAIYPSRPIHTALVWTTGPQLMLLPDSLLSRALDSAITPRLISSS